MSVANSRSHDDLLLARLSATKLADVMHGIMSVGVAALELRSPTDFLSGKDKVLLGFLEVLRCAGAKSGNGGVEVLQQVDELARLVVEFHTTFLELAQWRTMSRTDMRRSAERLASTYTRFFQSLGSFCSLVAVDSDYSLKTQQGRTRIDEFLQTVNPD